MANVDLVMRLLAEDRASDKFKKVGDSASLAERRMDKFRKVAGGISAAAITAFAVQSVRAFADAEAQQVKLEGAYKRFPKIADVSIESLRDMNSALQQTTTFDDDAVAGAQAMLAQFNLTGQQIQQVTPLLLDYAAATGKDLPSAATALGKSFLGQTRALKEVGINYKSTGDAGKDFANITDLLSQKVGGFAEDQGKTAAGQLAILENQFGDLQETVGGALVPAMTALIGVVKPVVQVVGKMPAPVLATGLGVAALGTAALIAVPKVLAFKAALIEANVGTAKLGKGARFAGKAVGAIAVYQAAGAILDSFGDSALNGARSTDALAQSLRDAALGKRALDSLSLGFKTAEGDVKSFGDALGYVVDNHWWNQLGSAISPVEQNFDTAKASIEGVDQALTSLVQSGDSQAAALAFSKLSDMATESGISIDDLKKALPLYAAAQANAKTSTEKGTTALTKQRSAVDEVNTAFKKLQGILDKGAAKDAWVSALGDIGAQAKEAKGRLLGNGDAAITLRGQLRDSVGALQTYADGFKNPIAKAGVMRQGIARIRETLIESGIKPKDVDAFLHPLQQAAEEGYVKGKNVGYNIGLGVTRGIAVSKADAIREAEKLGKAAVQAVRRGADVNSPSAYTTWVGEQVAVGLAVGARNGTAAAKDAMQRMSRTALSGIDTSYATSGAASSQGPTYRVATPAGAAAGTAQVNVYLDSKLVQTGLVDLKRTQGGRLNF